MFQHRFSLAALLPALLSPTHSQTFSQTLSFLIRLLISLTVLNVNSATEIWERRLFLPGSAVLVLSSSLQSVYHVHEASNSYFNMPTHSLFMHETIATRQTHSAFPQLSGLVIVTLTSLKHKLYSNSGGSPYGSPNLFYTGKEMLEMSQNTLLQAI